MSAHSSLFPCPWSIGHTSIRLLPVSNFLFIYFFFFANQNFHLNNDRSNRFDCVGNFCFHFYSLKMLREKLGGKPLRCTRNVLFILTLYANKSNKSKRLRQRLLFSICGAFFKMRSQIESKLVDKRCCSKTKKGIDQTKCRSNLIFSSHRQVSLRYFLNYQPF